MYIVNMQTIKPLAEVTAPFGRIPTTTKQKTPLYHPYRTAGTARNLEMNHENKRL
jgi:hypothetical protein